jgi:hypothetical protein
VLFCVGKLLTKSDTSPQGKLVEFPSGETVEKENVFGYTTIRTNDDVCAANRLGRSILPWRGAPY